MKAGHTNLLAAAALCASCASASTAPRYAVELPLTPTPEAEFRDAIPPPIERPAVPPLTAQHFALPNGFEIFVIERPQPPIVTLRYLARGAGIGMSGSILSEFTMRSLLAAGTKFDDGEELRDVRINGVAPYVIIHPLYSALELSVGSEALGAAISLLANTVRNPTFAELEPSRDFVLAKVRARASLVATIGRRMLWGALHGPTHPLAALPRSATEQVRHAGATALREEHARRFRPETSALLVAGAVSPAEVMKIATSQFGSWQPSAVPDRAETAVPFEPSYGTELLRNGSDRSYLAVGYAAVPDTHPDYWPLRLLGSVLSGNFAARANFSLRHEHALAYAVTTGVGSAPAGSCFIVETMIGTDNVGKTWKLLRDAIGDLRRRPLGESELEPARRALLLDLELQQDTNVEIAIAMSGLLAYGDTLEHLREIRRAVAAMTAEDVRRVARLYLKPEKEVRVVIGRHSEQEPQLQAMRPLRFHETRDEL